MTVFLTPEGAPFYGGTYFPPAPRHGLPSFPQLLHAIADAWSTRPAEVLASSEKFTAELNRSGQLRGAVQLLSDDILFRAFQAISGQFDEAEGGLGGSPKFPQPMIWEFVLRFWKRTGNDFARSMVQKTLTKMARGGMYDQLGGGFHRYSVDAHWLVPHFEKMLYDNAQLATLYLRAWLATGETEYRRVAEETLDYLLREMTHPAGGFFSAQDADSEGVEGKFFVWSPEEITAALPDAEMARAALAYWGADDEPNFEGHSILFVPRDPARVAEELGIPPERLAALIADARRRLYAVREARVHP